MTLHVEVSGDQQSIFVLVAVKSERCEIYISVVYVC